MAKLSPLQRAVLLTQLRYARDLGWRIRLDWWDGVCTFHCTGPDSPEPIYKLNPFNGEFLHLLTQEYVMRLPRLG